MNFALFVHRYPPAIGGAEAYTARLCDYLLRCGDRVQVWTTTAIDLPELWYPGKASKKRQESADLFGIPSDVKCEIRRYRPLYLPFRRYILKFLSLVPVRSWRCLIAPCNPICPKMWSEVNTYFGPIDAVHACAFPYTFPILCGLRLARCRGVPFYLTPFLHLGDFANPRNRIRRQFTQPHLRWLLRQADGVFVQTTMEQQAAIELGVNATKVHRQGLGVDLRECTNGERLRFRRAWGIRSEDVVVGHLANNSKEKGTIDLLQAAELAWEQGCRFQLVLAGPEMPNFQSYWRHSRQPCYVRRLGVLTHQQRRDFFAAIDVFALPSQCDSFGLVLLEAWANRKPNLVYRAGGPGELVRSGIDGLVARCGDIAELAQQLIRLINNSSLRTSLGHAGYHRLAHEFAWEDKLAFARSVMLGQASPSTVNDGANESTPWISKTSLNTISSLD